MGQTKTIRGAPHGLHEDIVIGFSQRLRSGIITAKVFWIKGCPADHSKHVFKPQGMNSVGFKP